MKIFFPVLGFLMFFPVVPQPAAVARKVVTAAQVNGTWRSRSNEFKVLAIGNQKLRVEFDGTYEYRVNGELMAHTGTGYGIAFIEGDTAIFRPEGTGEECAIKMKFTGGKLIVNQDGECGFGHNVTAIGMYRKVSGRKPSFSEH